MPRFREEPIAPILGSLLTEAVRDNLHHGLVDLALEELLRWLEANEETFADVLSERAPWWAPPRLNAAVTGRLHTEAIRWLADIRADPRHHAREALDSMLAQLAHDLLHDPDTQARAEAMKNRVLSHPQVIGDQRLPVEGVSQRAARRPAGSERAAARTPHRRGPGLRRTAHDRRGSSPPPRRSRRRPRGLRGVEVRRRGHRRHHQHGGTLGRRGGCPEDRAARRPRPPVHPDQRHDRRRPGRRTHPCRLCPHQLTRELAVVAPRAGGCGPASGSCGPRRGPELDVSRGRSLPVRGATTARSWGRMDR